MTGATQSTLGSVISGIALVASYAVVLWRIVRRNPSNRVIECGSIAIVIFFVMAALIKVPELPDWVESGLLILFLLLGFLMIFFLVQQGYDAIRRRRRDQSD
jgi:hypothetical protein